MSENERPTPRIYVADLAAYNMGHLHGRWIEIDSDATVEGICASIRAMLRQSPALPECIPEEYAIHDYEGFAGYEVDEYESLETVVAVGAFIREHGELGAKLLNRSYDIDDAKGVLDDQYAGAGESLAGWVAEFLEDSGQLAEIPEKWRSYIDFDQYARDLELGGDLFTIEAHGQVHVFWTR
ncbi:MAG: antirestriction protein ArdA [Polyangiaceae bacterium]|nr:antirestriction protein ArdA [Polyangiaceae bacterium]